MTRTFNIQFYPVGNDFLTNHLSRFDTYVLLFWYITRTVYIIDNRYSINIVAIFSLARKINLLQRKSFSDLIHMWKLFIMIIVIFMCHLIGRIHRVLLKYLIQLVDFSNISLIINGSIKAILFICQTDTDERKRTDNCMTIIKIKHIYIYKWFLKNVIAIIIKNEIIMVNLSFFLLLTITSIIDIGMCKILLPKQNKIYFSIINFLL